METAVELVSQKVAAMELQAGYFGVSMDDVHAIYLAVLRDRPHLTVSQAMDMTGKNIQLLSWSRN